MPSPSASPAARHRAGGQCQRLSGRVTTFRTPLLPQNSVRAAFQDRRGYLWFGTEEGVVRFDGAEWKSFRIADGLASSLIQSIAESRDGRMWFATRIGGISCFDPVHLSSPWSSLTTADGLPDVDVRAISAADDGTLWLATRGGLARVDPETMAVTPAGAVNDVSAILLRDGRVWAGSRTEGVGFLDLRTNVWHPFDTGAAAVTSLAADRSGAIWIGTYGEGLVRLDPGTGGVRRLGVDDGIPEDKVLVLLCDRAGDLWAGTESGGFVCLRVQRAPGVPRVSVLPEPGMTNYIAMSILQDRNGVYWLGSLAGLTCFEPEGTYRAKTWTTFRTDDGLAHDIIRSIAHDSAGRYWFGTYGGGATSLTMHGEDRIWESFDAELPNKVVQAVIEDALGRIWMATFGGGLVRFDPATRTWRVFTTADGLAGHAVRVLRIDPAGRMWAGTDGGGISVFDPLEEPPSFANITREHGLPSNRVSSILHDSRGRVLAGTYEGGVAILENGVWSVISRHDGLPANDVYCIAEDPAGRLWFGTGGSGLASVADGRWRVYTERDGLPNDTVYQVLVESERSIYASTNRGVFRLRFEDDREVIVSFDRADGLGDDECNGGASLRDRRGFFWFGTLGGASFIDPRDVPERIPPCRVYVTGFDVHDQPMNLDVVEPIEDSRLEFSFTYGAVEFVSPHKVRYRTRLAGFDRNWSKVTTERRIRYTNLRPGRYRFQVQARNWGGEWSEPAEIAFEVVPDRERLAREEALERERIEKRLLELQAREDALTGLLNRRYLDAQLQQEYDRALRFKRPLSVVMADIDHFKSVNDRFSHAIGDEVLRVVARLMRTSIRSIDTVARYGGEEFALLLPETARAAATGVCEKIRRTIEEHPWCGVHPDLRVTMSFGCVDDTGTGSAADMLHRADEKLFEAKRSGRNRVV